METYKKYILTESTFVVSHKGTVIKITGFKKGDNSDDDGQQMNEIISVAIDNIKKYIDSKYDIKEILIKLK